MPFSDNLALFRARLAANLPQASLANNSLFMSFAQAFLSADADTQSLISAVQPDLFLLTATGKALDRKTADYGVVRDGGAAASVTLTFSFPPGQTASTLVVIPVGTSAATVGDGYLTASIVFTTTAVAQITPGGASVDVAAMATTVGALTNVGAHSIVVPLSGALGGTLVVDNAQAATGGRDPQTDTSLRSAALATIASKYSPTALHDTVLGVDDVFDVLVVDPQDGSGHVFITWCDVLGAQPGLVGSDAEAVIAPNTLAAAVHSAVLHVLPPTIVPFYEAFTVFDVTVSGTYMALPGLASSTLEPLIQAAIVKFINGLSHGQAVVPYLLVQAVSAGLGTALLNFVPTISPLAATDPAQTPTTVLYRYPAIPSSIALTRV